jgi:predicted phage tail protein
MPPIIAVIVTVLTAVGFSSLTALAIAPFVLSIGASLVLGAVSKMLQKNPSSSGLASTLASRSIATVEADQPFED